MDALHVLLLILVLFPPACSGWGFNEGEEVRETSKEAELILLRIG